MSDHDDDVRLGRVLNRREVLALFGGGAAFVAGCAQRQGGSAGPATPSAATPGAGGAKATSAPVPPAGVPPAAAPMPVCVVRPEQTEGPYFVDERLNRSDIRTDPSDGSVRPGAPLYLTFRVTRVAAGTCTPLAGAMVDVWHCDAAGVYSDVSDPGFVTTGRKFLRGYQTTDPRGQAAFTTVYPGWYQGRAVHIHFKIRTGPGAATGTGPGMGTGTGTAFTSQLYFNDELTDRVHARPPYAAKGQRTLRNGGDGIYRSGGMSLTLDTAVESVGYAATFDIGLQI